MSENTRLKRLYNALEYDGSNTSSIGIEGRHRTRAQRMAKNAIRGDCRFRRCERGDGFTNFRVPNNNFYDNPVNYTLLPPTSPLRNNVVNEGNNNEEGNNNNNPINLFKAIRPYNPNNVYNGYKETNGFKVKINGNVTYVDGKGVKIYDEKGNVRTFNFPKRQTTLNGVLNQVENLQRKRILSYPTLQYEGKPSSSSFRWTNLPKNTRMEALKSFNENALNKLSLLNKEHHNMVNAYRRQTMTPEKLRAHIENMIDRKKGNFDSTFGRNGLKGYTIPEKHRLHPRFNRVRGIHIKYGDERVVVKPSHLWSLRSRSVRKIPFTKTETTYNGVINQLTKLYNNGISGHGRSSLGMRNHATLKPGRASMH